MSCSLYVRQSEPMKTFAEWKKLFSEQKLNDFDKDSSGVVWLKLKSMDRKAIREDFITKNKLAIMNDKTAFEALYNLYANGSLPVAHIDAFLYEYNQSELRDLRFNFQKIKAELYNMQSFSWGGDAANSLDKQIVRYVKNCWIYAGICNKIDNEIADSTKRYTLSSWYNNWSAILTEYLFKSHPKTISAIGKVKSVDFFIGNIPIDLKITYFPKAYLKQKRKEQGLGDEYALLKTLAKKKKVAFDGKASEERAKYQIIEQLKDLHDAEADVLLRKLDRENKAIIRASATHKEDLITWLYEQQGELRFGAENRLFLILVDSNNLSESWKLKRNFDLLAPKIKKYLDAFKPANLATVSFSFNNRVYTSRADALFITQETLHEQTKKSRINSGH